jgi:adenylate cyclase
MVAQLLIRLRPPKQTSMSEEERADFQRAAHIYEYLSEQYFFQNDSLAVLNGTLASLNLAEQCGAIRETIRGYSALALGMAMSGLVRVARAYGKSAIRLAEEHGALSEIAWVRLVLGVLAYGLGEWDIAERDAREAEKLYELLGDRKRAQNSKTMGIFVSLLRGDIKAAEKRLMTLFSERPEDWPLQVRARVLIDSAVRTHDWHRLKEVRELADAKLIRTDQLLCVGVAAKAYSDLQEFAIALELAEKGLTILRECGVVWGGYVFGAAGVADVFLTEWERSADSVPLSIKSQASIACRELARLARTSSTCRPYALLMNGRLWHLRGHKRRANVSWREAAKAAESLQMPMEQARASYEMGSALREDDPNRAAHLDRAVEILERLGATQEAVRIKGVERHHRSAVPAGSAI